MIKCYYNEIFTDLNIDRNCGKKSYAVSNFGRVASKDTKPDSLRLLKCGKVNGYSVLKVVVDYSIRKVNTYFVHKLVAELYLPKPSEEHIYVLHKDYSKLNNIASNLFWATEAEYRERSRNHPSQKARIAKRQETPWQTGHKLNSTQVMRIKKKLFDPDRTTRMKIIAKQFGISEMQLYRIRTGENWGHVCATIMGRPVSNWQQFTEMIESKQYSAREKEQLL
jgi:hypothetical protein